MCASFLRSKVLRIFSLGWVAIFVGCSSSAVDSTEAFSTPVTLAPDHPSAQVAPLEVSAEALSPGLDQIVKLARGGVGEEVMLAFVMRSETVFQPTADEILLLSDLGVSQRVVAMLLKPPGSRQMQEAIPQSVASAPAVEAVAVPAVAPVAGATAVPAPTTVVVQQTVVEANPSVETLIELPPQETQVVRYFWPSLEPFGTWVQMRDYGWCWRPTVALNHAAWRPYADHGRWIYTDMDWYWLSDYSWGWATFHYGRWFLDSSQGWCWLPDSTWAPAWVSWRRSNDYCGWAPLPPMGRHFSHAGYPTLAVRDFGLHASQYAYVPILRLCEEDPLRYCASGSHFDFLHGRSTAMNHFRAQGGVVLNVGLEAGQYAAATGINATKVSVRALSGDARPDQLHHSGNGLLVYRPDLKQLPLIPSVAEIDRSRNEERKAESTHRRGGAEVEIAGAQRTGGNHPDRAVHNGAQPPPANGSSLTTSTEVAQSLYSSQAGVPVYSGGVVGRSNSSRYEPGKPSSGARSTRASRASQLQTPTYVGENVSSTRPFSPPQPITSVPQALGVDVRPMTPPRPITTVPQALGVAARPFTASQPVTTAPAYSNDGIRQVREPGRYEPSRNNQPQETPRWEQTARRQFEPQAQQSPWERTATRQLQGQFHQPSPSQFPKPSPSQFPGASRPQHSQPAAPATPAVAPARPSAPAASDAPQGNAGRRSGDSNSPSKRSESRR